MKLFHAQVFNAQASDQSSQQTGLSERLNRWLWPQLNSALFASDEQSEGGLSVVDAAVDSCFVGAGTLGCVTSRGADALDNQLLESRLAREKLVLFGTGVGCEPPVRALPLNWDVRCVRGPLSARKLGLPISKSITDATILVAEVFRASNEAFDGAANEEKGCSFMPDMRHALAASEHWQQLCQQAGLRYIDPRWPIERLLSAIAASERLLAEDLQGAMLADALRIPWIPVVTSPRICAFEWQDWCLSMALFYHPYRLPALKDYPRWDVSIQALRHWLNATLEGPTSTPQYELLSADSIIVQRLANISKQAPTLSRDEVFSQKLTAMKQCFSQLCRQFTRNQSTRNIMMP